MSEKPPTHRIHNLADAREFRRAGATDLVLVRGENDLPLFYPKQMLVRFARCVVSGIHLMISGQPGSGKTQFLRAMWLRPENWRHLFDGLELGKEVAWRELKVWHVALGAMEVASELWSHKEIREGETRDVESRLVRALREYTATRGRHYGICWIAELGRFTPEVMSALVALIEPTVVMPDGERLDLRGLTFVTDSNYAAKSGGEGTYLLAPLDEALANRFPCTIVTAPLAPEREATALRALAPDADGEVVDSAVRIVAEIRRRKAEGALLDTAWPTMRNLLAYVTLARNERDLCNLAEAVFVGLAAGDDRQLLRGIVAQALGLSSEIEAGEPAAAESMF